MALAPPTFLCLVPLRPSVHQDLAWVLSYATNHWTAEKRKAGRWNLLDSGKRGSKQGYLIRKQQELKREDKNNTGHWTVGIKVTK